MSSAARGHANENLVVKRNRDFCSKNLCGLPFQVTMVTDL